jgi:hypothetical protein
MSDIKKDVRKARECLRNTHSSYSKELRELHVEYENQLFEITSKIDKFLEGLENNE